MYKGKNIAKEKGGRKKNLKLNPIQDHANKDSKRTFKTS